MLKIQTQSLFSLFFNFLNSQCQSINKSFVNQLEYPSMANRATAPLHSRMSSVATTNTAATYGLLDYYADSDNDHDEVDDEEESLNFDPIHQQNNKTINHRFNKSNSPNPIQEEVVSTIRVPNNDESLNLTNLSRTEFIELQKKISSNLSISDTTPTS